ncbi:MAG TPA: hypothetical protein VIU61_01690 [Kofleriaceae bacterium]
MRGAAVLVLVAGCHLVFELEELVVPTDASRVSAGALHTCAIDATGLWCWGDNLFGQVGNGLTTPEILGPTRIETGTWAEVDTGYAHSCAIDEAGQLWCWGSNFNGQLGLGMQVGIRSTPAMLPGSWKSLALAWLATCAIDTSDALYCWGRSVPARGTNEADLFAPTPITVMPAWRQVASGAKHTCAIASDGSLWCWGQNYFGEVGDGMTSEVSPPTRIDAATEWRTVTVGTSHTCAVNIADELYCWGSRATGELGAPIQDSTRPTRVGTERWSDIAAGGRFTCGRRLDGSTWCWGANLMGQLGIEPAARSVMPTEVPLAITALSLGDRHACAIIGKAVQCTGSNAYGQLGDNTGGSRLDPVLVEVARPELLALTSRATCVSSVNDTVACWGVNDHGEHGRGDRDERQVPATFDANFAGLAAGGQSVCAIADEGTRRVFCWGDNQFGQLALGSTDMTSVAAPALTLLTDVDQVVLGRGTDPSQPTHGCASAINTGLVSCWGANTSGQLGIPADAALHPTPGFVENPIGMRRITAGARHTCGVGLDDLLWCWGDNAAGQLGVPSAGVMTHAKQQVPGVWRTVSAGEGHSCAIDITDGLWCWGGNSHGQVGDQSQVNRDAPVKIDDGTLWAEVASGTRHTCAIQRDDRSLWCWGDNTRGQLGDGTTELRLRPQLASTAAWASIAAGEQSTCGTQMDGTLWCWGDNLYGQVGDGSAWHYGYEPIAR